MRRPGIPLCDRLEDLRDEMRLTPREWVDALNKNVSRKIPLATCRRYHRDQEPPHSYLIKVARAFNVRIEWLATGIGPRACVHEYLPGGPEMRKRLARLLAPDDIRLISGLTRWDAPDTGTVYFLVRRGVVEYIGQTSRPLDLRLHHHKYLYDEVWYIEVARDDLDDVELRYIQKLTPRHNTIGVSA